VEESVDMKESSPKHHEAAVAEVSNETPAEDDEMAGDSNNADSKPSASDLARKRAERFGIPVVATETVKPVDSEMVSEEVETKADEAKVESSETPKESFDKYDPLIASAITENSIVESGDFVIDNANLRRLDKVIELHGEDKVKEVVVAVIERINKEFEGDRSKIRAPPRLATSRLSFGLKQILSKSERKHEDKPRTNDSRVKKDDRKDNKKWTDEEWDQWKKSKGSSKDDGKGWKSNSYDDKKDWGNKKSSYQKNSDPFESDVEEFIYRNRLDKRASEAMRTESRGMITYVMDQGFTLAHKFDNPSKEVILRMADYRKSKERGGAAPSRSHSKRVPSPSPRGRSISRDRSDARYRSRSRSYSRDRYVRGSRSMSR
jgi:hypothetical protein